MGRLTDYKRLDLLLRLWDRVRHVTGGQLVIAGDGPERPRLQALAGPGVVFTGRVSEQEKHRLLCAAWMLVHPALIEGWGIVVAEAAIRGTPAVAFDVPGLRDSVVHGQTGMLVQTEGQFASAWASLAINSGSGSSSAGRRAPGRSGLHWSAAVDGFAEVADEAIKRGRSLPCRLPHPHPPRVTRSRSFTRLRGSRLLGPGPGPAPGPDAAPRTADVAGPAVVIDVGCGDGSALAVAAGQNPGHRFAGVDWSSGALRQARGSWPACAARRDGPAGRRRGCRRRRIMSELIEHLVDPDGAVAEVRRVLRPGGSLLLSTPNLAAWYNRALLAAASSRSSPR